MASHPSPFYRNRQSNKALDPNGPTAKFLYTILKQLDLKNIDWNEVAGELDITNGHAARMRWSRFRAQIEGLDNSYSRQSGKKRDGEKKRKREKQGDSANSGEPTDQKKIKPEHVTDYRQEMASQLNPYGGLGMPAAVKNEYAEKTSIINGVTVHHPKMTTIEMPHAPMNTSTIKQEPFTASSTTSPSNGAISKPMPMASPAAQIFRPPTFQPDLPWSSRMPSPNYVHRFPIPLNNIYAYAPVSMNYTSGMQYPGPYIGHNGQQRMAHSPQQPRNFAQQPNYHSYGSLPSSGFPSSTSAAAPNLSSITASQPRPDPPAQEPSTVPTNTATLNTSAGPNDNEVRDAAQMCELLTDASYPWPYSEADLAEFTRQFCNVQGDGHTIEGNVVDVSDTDAEHVLELDDNTKAQSCGMSLPNADHSVETSQQLVNEITSISEPNQQVHKPGVPEQLLPSPIVFPPRLPSDVVKKEPDL